MKAVLDKQVSGYKNWKATITEKVGPLALCAACSRASLGDRAGWGWVGGRVGGWWWWWGGGPKEQGAALLWCMDHKLQA